MRREIARYLKDLLGAGQDAGPWGVPRGADCSGVRSVSVAHALPALGGAGAGDAVDPLGNLTPKRV